MTPAAASLQQATQPRMMASVFTPSHTRDANDSTYLLRRVRDLQGTVGAVHEASVSAVQERLSTGLGDEVDWYLSAHGYTAEAAGIIADSYRRYLTSNVFVAFLCGRGMPHSEAEWIWGFICRCQQQYGQ